MRFPALILTSLGLMLTTLACKPRGSRSDILEAAGESSGPEDDVEHFKYGSIGAEEASGIPYFIWQAMPKVCELNGGYEKFGLITEPGRDRPVGFGRKVVNGIDAVGLNCAACHTGTVREMPSSVPQLYVAMPAISFDIIEYFKFVFQCASDPKFNPEHVLKVINQDRPEGARLPSEYSQVIALTKTALMEKAKGLAPLVIDLPHSGPGRVDTFKQYKLQTGYFNRFGGDTTKEPPGIVDFPAIWNQRPRTGMHLHWDGNNSSIEERNLSASIGAGASPATIDHASLARVVSWLQDFKAPQYPFRINQTWAKSGRMIYESQKCGSCHDIGGVNTGKVQPISDLGTDSARIDSFTPEFVATMNQLGTGYDWKFKNFKKTNGYANLLLDGVWLRAPYLHNGSVPTLTDLFEGPAKRPITFYRGSDIYDQTRVGFETKKVQGSSFLFDTRLIGNGNKGHTFGTDLSPDEKRDLIEYLKTL